MNLIPQQVTLFLVGALIAIGVGYSIVNPRASLIRLGPAGEKRFRARQSIVALVFSLLLGLTLIFEEVRNSSLGWLLLPIIALPVGLWLWAFKTRKRS